MNKIKIVVSKITLLLVVGTFVHPLPLAAEQAIEFERDVLSIETRSGTIFEFDVELAVPLPPRSGRDHVDGEHVFAARYAVC